MKRLQWKCSSGQKYRRLPRELQLTQSLKQNYWAVGFILYSPVHPLSHFICTSTSLFSNFLTMFRSKLNIFSIQLEISNCRTNKTRVVQIKKLPLVKCFNFRTLKFFYSNGTHQLLHRRFCVIKYDQISNYITLFLQGHSRYRRSVFYFNR